jgi:hypothetical protein
MFVGTAALSLQADEMCAVNAYSLVVREWNPEFGDLQIGLK